MMVSSRCATANMVEVGKAWLMVSCTDSWHDSCRIKWHKWHMPATLIWLLGDASQICSKWRNYKPYVTYVYISVGFCRYM